MNDMQLKYALLDKIMKLGSIVAYKGDLSKEIEKTKSSISEYEKSEIENTLRHFQLIPPVGDTSRVKPAPQIARPAFQALGSEPLNSAIGEMWRELLSNASDSDRLKFAHPSFPSLINRLSSDEATILQYLYNRPKSRLMIDIYGEINASGRIIEHARIKERDQVPGVIFPENYEFYYENISSCGLIQYYQWSFEIDPTDEYGGTWVFPDKKVPIHRVPVQVRLTQVGKFFMNAVSPPIQER